MDKSRAKEIVKEIIDICGDYSDCENCPFNDILEKPNNHCVFDGWPDDMNVNRSEIIWR